MARKRGRKKRISEKNVKAGTEETPAPAKIEDTLKDLEKSIAAAKSKTEDNSNKNTAPIAAGDNAGQILYSNPLWFYISSIFAAFMFTSYISIFAAIHFENIDYMNMTIVFMFIVMVSFFLISSLFFISEKKQWHSISAAIFFIGVASVMIYAFKAVDTSNLVRYSIIYTIIVAAISSYVLAIRK